MGSPDTSALLAKWAAGDSQAAATLIEQHFALVYRFFANKTAEETAADLAQQTFASVHAAVIKPSERPIKSFPAFLMTVARNRLMSHFRTRGVEARVFDPAAVSVQQADPATGLNSLAIRDQEHQLLREALVRIPIDAQITLELYYWESMSTSEIAEVLGIAAGTVMSRLARARTRLREELAQLAADPSVVQESLEQLTGGGR